MKNALAILAGVIIVVLVAVSPFLLLTKPKNGPLFPRRTPVQCSPENPFEYRLDSLTKIDSSLIGYLESGRVQLPLDATPQAIASFSDSLVYVAGGNRIITIDRQGSLLKTLEVGEPVVCLTVAPDGRLYAGSLKTIRRYAVGNGSFDKWEVGGAKSYIVSIAVSDDNIFAADAGMQVVIKLDSNGKVTGKIGSKDTAMGVPGFIVPSSYMDVAIGIDGSLWAVNPGRHLVENYRPNGDRLSSWGSSGTNIESFCGCCGPIQMAMLGNGSFVTAEKGIVRIKVYDPSGQFSTVVAPPSAFNPKETNLDLAIDSKGNILVLESHEKRIKIFSKKKY
jgi:hypothetical protein